MRRIPAYRGEFGLCVRFWVPQVHALCLREPCVVEVEPGCEALYPAAREWVEAPRIESDAERAAQCRPPDLGVGEARFVPGPHVPQGVGPVDVVVCPRRLSYGTSKNWDAWPGLARSLMGDGLDVFSGGIASGSYDVEGVRAWDFERPLDATIEAMQRARLVVATDAGLAHLAVLCGAPLMLVTYRGRVAPGPVIDSSGRRAADDYWPVRLAEYYEAANHMGAPIRTVDGWENPNAVVEAVLSWI